MVRKTLLVTAFLLITSISLAQDTADTTLKQPDLQKEHVNLTELKQQYNSRSGEVPEFVGSIIGDQTITVNLTGLETGEEMLKKDLIGVETNGVKTEQIKWGGMEEPTLKIWIDESDVEKLSKAENPQQTLKKMLKTQEIRYETYTLGNSIKMGIMQFFLSF